MMLRVTAALGLFVCSTAQAAGLGPIPGEERFDGLLKQDKQDVGMQVGASKLAEDWFIALTPRLDLNLGPVGLGLQVPLNLRIVDLPPENTGDYFGVLRKEDWDEAAEYAKIIRYLRFGNKRDFIYVRIGEQAATIGHATIMNRYFNNLDINTTRVGVAFDVNTEWGGFETIAGDLGTLYDPSSPDSRIVGGRIYVKPMAFYDPTSIFNIFAIGATVISDTNAPRTFEYDANGDPKVKDERLVVADDTAATVYGFDFEVDLLSNALLDVIPYTDLNFFQQGGMGFHAGVLATAKMPIGLELQIPVRLEYRHFDADYLPQYFDVFYEIERYNKNITGEPIAKAPFVRKSTGPGLDGFYGDFAFDFAGLVQVGGLYEDYTGSFPSLQAFVSIPALETIQFKAFYARTNIDGLSDAFKLDDRSLAVAQARYEMFTYVYLVARATQRWALITRGPQQGEFEGVREYKFGLEVAFTF